MHFASYPSLAGRLVLVTGGATGIGADIVRAFARNGARVAFLDILADAAHALVAELADAPHPPRFWRCDLVDVAALQSTIARIVADLGPVEVLVNNAANDERHRFEDVTPDYWDLNMAINARPQFFCAQAVQPGMKALGRGAIINLSSIAWRNGAAEMPVYAAAKSSILGLTRALARAFGPDGIRVNAIEPGAVMTERQRQLWYKTDASVSAVVERQAIRKVLLGEEIARAALFLAADDSAMITKQSIIVDAGLS